jgi:hypothetical protein
MSQKRFHGMSEISFAHQMENKSRVLDSTDLLIGVDFAVFKFAYPYIAEKAATAFENSNANYDYIILREGKRLLIYNQHYKI